MHIEVVEATGRDTLGECPVWDARTATLFWVDQMAPSVRSLNTVTGTVRSWALKAVAGSLGLSQDEGELVLAQPEGFSRLRLDTGVCTLRAPVPHADAGIRMNDGRCDRHGAFIAGSLDPTGAQPRGCLYRWNPDGGIDVLQRGLRVTNGVCFDAPGERMYFTDSRTGVLMASRYEPAGGAVFDAFPFADTRPLGSVPDGATVDAEGGVWVALIENGKVARFLPDGSLDRTVQLPAPHVTSVCFGGADLDVLYVTSIRDTGMRLRTDHPLGGALFAVTGLGVRGVREGCFGA